jgi:hypothetical protein
MSKPVDHEVIDARRRELLAQLEKDMQMVLLAKENTVERLSGGGRHADDGDPSAIAPAHSPFG